MALVEDYFIGNSNYGLRAAQAFNCTRKCVKPSQVGSNKFTYNTYCTQKYVGDSDLHKTTLRFVHIATFPE